MNTVTTPNKTLVAARHLVGMAIVAAANPLIYYANDPITRWLANILGALVFAGVFYGLYALFFTARAKAAWPKSFYTLAWVLLVLITIEPYLTSFNASKPAHSGSAAPETLKPFTGKLDGQ